MLELELFKRTVKRRIGSEIFKEILQEYESQLKNISITKPKIKKK